MERSKKRSHMPVPSEVTQVSAELLPIPSSVCTTIWNAFYLQSITSVPQSRQTRMESHGVNWP
jgi:hypothetical protein